MTGDFRCDKVFCSDHRPTTDGERRGACMKKILIVCCAVLLLLVVLLPRQTADSKRFKVSYLDLFDTYTELTIYAADEAEATGIASAAEEELRVCNDLYDIYYNYDGMNNLKPSMTMRELHRSLWTRGLSTCSYSANRCTA